VDEIEVLDGKETILMNALGWPNGMYFVQLIINGKAIANQKVIVH